MKRKAKPWPVRGLTKTEHALAEAGIPLSPLSRDMIDRLRNDLIRSAPAKYEKPKRRKH